MAVLKRITAEVGASHPEGKQASTQQHVCPHCHRQTRPVVVGRELLCALCGKALV